eukprot:6205325-Pleurochrysis_carterae.AAC.1
MGPEGALAVVREARAFRADTGMTAGVAARGEFAARTLHAREAASPARGTRAQAAGGAARGQTGASPARASATSTALTAIVD